MYMGASIWPCICNLPLVLQMFLPSQPQLIVVVVVVVVVAVAVVADVKQEICLNFVIID